MIRIDVRAPRRLAALIACTRRTARADRRARGDAAHGRGRRARRTLKIAPIVYRERRLANGLQVLSVDSHASPTVSVQVWYHVGSRDDPAGRSGFAHLFEHMMFKGTTYLRAEQFDRLTEDVGGANNASTARRRHRLRRGRAVEPPRDAALGRGRANDEPQGRRGDLQVGARRRRRGIPAARPRASPYGRLFNVALVAASYLQHPYKRPGIGSIEDLEAATLADVVAFHKRYYRPDNATLDRRRRLRSDRSSTPGSTSTSARSARPAEPLPQLDASEPPWTERSQRQGHRPAGAVAGGRVHLAGTAGDSADAPALQVAAAVLAAGESSRLNQSLVYRQRVATQAGFSADLRVGPGPADRLRDRRRRQVDRRARRGAARRSRAPRERRRRARPSWPRSRPSSSRTPSRRARRRSASPRALAEAAVLRRRPGARQQRARRPAARQRRRRAARACAATSSTRTRWRSTIARKRRPSHELRAASPVVAPRSRSRSRSLAGGAVAQPYTTPPPPAAPRPLTIAAPSEMKLDNGLRVIVARREGVPLVSAELVALAGAEADPPRLAGLASLSASLMTQGTRRHSAPQLAAAAEALGGSLDSGAGWNHALVSITVTTPKLDAALALVAEVAREPVFAHDEIERVRTQALDGSRSPTPTPGTLAATRRPAPGLWRRRLRPPRQRHARLAAADRARRPGRRAPPGVPARQRGADPRRRHRRRRPGWRWRAATSAAGPRPATPLAAAPRAVADPSTARSPPSSTWPSRARPASSWRCRCPSAATTSARSARSSTRSSAAATRRA